LRFASLLVFSLVAAVFLVRGAEVKYDSSGPCLFDSEYTQETTTSTGGSKSVSYKVSYNFVYGGAQYSGKDTIYQEPTSSEATVYFIAANPGDNALSPTGWNRTRLIAAGIAFLVAILAYWRLPKDHLLTLGFPARSASAGVVDSGNENLRMARGKYHAWAYVHLAFFAQVALVAALAAWLLSLASGAGATGYAILGIATTVAVVAALWVYSDRWGCIEAFSSQACSGWVNFSVFYVPAIAFVYANYRGFRKLLGR
jgi:hypothetical protein